MTTTKTTTKATAEHKAKTHRVVRSFGIAGGAGGELRALPLGMDIPEGHLPAEVIAKHVAAGDLEEV